MHNGFDVTEESLFSTWQYYNTAISKGENPKSTITILSTAFLHEIFYFALVGLHTYNKEYMEKIKEGNK
jgi:hypothetical protein